jgi:hypothetical protein
MPKRTKEIAMLISLRKKIRSKREVGSSLTL